MPCSAWCNAFTCEQAACATCGPAHGCSVAKYGIRNGASSRDACASWCTQYTCQQADCNECGRDHGCEGREPPSPPSPPPIPALPPIRDALLPGSVVSGQQQLQLQRPAAEYFTYGSSMFTTAWFDEDGLPARVRIRGASWFGMETRNCVIGGAAYRSIESIAAWLHDHGFNAVRVPVAADAILNPSQHACLANGDRESIRLHNLALGSLNYLEQIAEVVRVAADAGLLVLLDMHVLSAGHWPDGGSVTGSAQRGMLLSAWERLAQEFCDEVTFWNVFGADLKNEPYTMMWNEDAPPDQRWDLLASTVAQRVHELCPRWLLFVQGVGADGCKEHATACARPAAGKHQATDLSGAGIWWGENLQAAKALPVSAVAAGEVGLIRKVVYSPRTCTRARLHDIPNSPRVPRATRYRLS